MNTFRCVLQRDSVEQSGIIVQQSCRCVYRPSHQQFLIKTGWTGIRREPLSVLSGHQSYAEFCCCLRGPSGLLHAEICHGFAALDNSCCRWLTFRWPDLSRLQGAGNTNGNSTGPESNCGLIDVLDVHIWKRTWAFTYNTLFVFQARLLQCLFSLKRHFNKSKLSVCYG